MSSGHDPDRHSSDLGALAAAGSAFLVWGLAPIYWKQMHGVSAVELIAHRITWSLALVVLFQWFQGSFASLLFALRNPRVLANGLACGLLLAVNWGIYIWAVNAGHVIESSLGYFLTPLTNVAFGYLLLHERMRTLQWAAIGFAALGVLLLLIRAGHVPWIALTLAATWGAYGMLKKTSQLGAIAGLTLETLAIFPFAAAFLLWRAYTGEGALGHVDLRLHLFILSVGVVTTVPLVLFAYGAQRLKLATIGLLQYFTPSAQFLIGLFVYHEPFDAVRLQACVLIWIGLVVYTGDSFWAQRRILWRVARPR